MRIGKVGWVLTGFVAAIAALGLWKFPLGLPPTAVADTVEDRSVFYRLISKYQYGGETIDFDIVVGCAVRVTEYTDGGSSYDAMRRPRLFAKATKDGAAIWQIVPVACGNETTDNGRVPADFLPGAIWFDSKDDFSLGIAYITEDAFESPSSKLKFLGAQIHSSTREDYDAFQAKLATNLIEPELLARPRGGRLTESQARLIMWDRVKLAEVLRGSFSCYGLARFRFSDPDARAILRAFAPASKSRFWRPDKATALLIRSQFDALNNRNGALLDNAPLRDYFSYGTYRTRGFPTRSLGGTIGGGEGKKVPPAIFPLSADDGLPWAMPSLTEADVIWRDVHLGPSNQGFAYCYSLLRGTGPLFEMHVPGYAKRTFGARASGLPIDVQEARYGANFPSSFYEGDEYIYLYFSFGLS